MPLIVMCGVPSSGKSTRARQIADFITQVGEEQKDGREVVLVNEEMLGLAKDLYLRDPQQEKILRASLKSAVEKFIDAQRVVILDSLNYIKGYRYELYCLARSANTQICNVFCDTDMEVAREWNAQNYENAHPVELFEDFCSRLERPQPSARWDKPCFRVCAEDATPLEEIWEAINQKSSKPRAPVSTQPEALFSEDFIHLLDRSCSEVICFVQQTGQTVGDSLGMPNCKVHYRVVRALAPLQLKALKRDFIALCKVQPPRENAIKEAFVEFLNARQEAL